MSQRIERPIFGELSEWREFLDQNAALLRSIAGRDPLPSDGAEIFECHRDRAAVASLFPDAVDIRNRSIAAAAAAAHAAALAQVRRDGSIELATDAGPRRFPAGSRALTPGLWPDAWGVSLVARDHNATAALSSDAAVDACGLFPGADRFWRPVFAALAALVVSPSLYAELAALARRAVAATPETVVEPGYTDHLVEPLLSLGDKLVAGVPDAWNAALSAALLLHRNWFAVPDRAGDTAGLLNFRILGITSLAHDRGVPTEIDSDYLPRDLVTGNFTRSAPAVRYVYPLHRLRLSDEANWFLDLEGFPRSNRRHSVVRVDGRLVARYAVSNSPQIPLAVADFELPGSATPGSSPPDALDLGELVLAASLLARRDSLDEAAAAAEAARDRIPPGADRTPESLFHTERGREAWLKEPGRFSRARLDAYATSLRSRQESSAQAMAYESIALIRAQVEPILRVIGSDRSGEAVALLRPRPDDYAKVFTADAVAQARAVYEPLWQQPLEMDFPSTSQTELLCHIAPAGMFAEPNELTRPFPEGYRAIAGWLNPHRIWVAWKFVAKGQTSGLAYDGLVWCDDHWAWFPKPYRALRPLAAKPS